MTARRAFAAVVLAALLLPLSGCGTYAWWACTGSPEQCSPAEVAVTTVQMDNTLDGVRRDLCRAEAAEPGKVSPRRLLHLREAVAIADATAATGDLAEYVRTVTAAERAAERVLPQLYGHGGWTPTPAQRGCQWGAHAEPAVSP